MGKQEGWTEDEEQPLGAVGFMDYAARIGLVLLGVFAFTCVVLSLGCASMGDEKVEGWPNLEIVEHYVAHHEMRNRCRMYVGFGQAPEACAEFSFSAARCDIWFSADFPPASFVVAHERQHCLGFDHVGSTSMKAMLALHRGQQ